MAEQVLTRVPVTEPVASARVPRVKKTKKPSFVRRFKWPIGLIVPVLIILLWWLAYSAKWVNPILFSSPLTVAETLATAALDGSLWVNILASVQRWILGFLIGGALGLFFGAITGLSRMGERLLDTTFQMLRTVPIMGLVPLFVIWYGLGEPPKIILIAFASMFQVYLSTYAGIRNIDRKLVEVGRVYQLSTIQMFFRIILPAAMPQILQGVRLGLGVAWLALVIAELSGAQSGIGFWMQEGREYVRVDIVLAALIVFAVVGKLVDMIVRFFEKRLLGWRDNIERDM